MQINKETIEQLFRQHYLRMYQLARVLLKDDAASKDVVSEVFADVLDGKTQLGLDNETIASNSPDDDGHGIVGNDLPQTLRADGA